MLGAAYEASRREIARKIVAAMRVWPEQIRWAQGERLIASALNDAQLAGRVRN